MAGGLTHSNEHFGRTCGPGGFFIGTFHLRQIEYLIAVYVQFVNGTFYVELKISKRTLERLKGPAAVMGMTASGGRC